MHETGLLNLADSRVDKVWKPDAEGRIREISAQVPAKVHVGTDLQLRYALQRRGLALEIANVCSYNAHELWAQVLMTAIGRAAPAGYSRVSFNQARDADMELWKFIAQSCRDGLRWSMGARAPFEAALEKAMVDASVRLLLMPLPVSQVASGSAASGLEPEAGSESKAKKRRERKREAAKQRKNQSPPAKRQKGAGKGKQAKPPAGLEGKALQTSAGEPICWNYNLRGCPNAKPGQKCGRGWHLCAEPGCQKAHALSSHQS